MGMIFGGRGIRDTTPAMSWATLQSCACAVGDGDRGLGVREDPNGEGETPPPSAHLDVRDVDEVLTRFSLLEVCHCEVAFEEELHGAFRIELDLCDPLPLLGRDSFLDAGLHAGCDAQVAVVEPTKRLVFTIRHEVYAVGETLAPDVEEGDDTVYAAREIEILALDRVLGYHVSILSPH